VRVLACASSQRSEYPLSRWQWHEVPIPTCSPTVNTHCAVDCLSIACVDLRITLYVPVVPLFVTSCIFNYVGEHACTPACYSSSESLFDDCDARSLGLIVFVTL